MTIHDIIAAGYAIPAYTIRNDIKCWRMGADLDARIYELPADAVPLHDLPNVGYRVAKRDDVLRVAKG